ncbi:MAG: hypothetical protein M0T73_03925 [Deltaproteobacteria bacterium]|nr:hypothetical protein [Deltaproteobacteria bacterium]
MRFSEGIPPRYPEGKPLEEDLGLWWVIHSKPNREWKLARYLLNQEISYYMPLYDHKIRIGKLHEKIIKAPLFRGYLCVALDREKHWRLYDTHDFARIIQIKEQNSFVKELQSVSRVLAVEQDLLVKPGLLKGRRVVVTSGPLKGVAGMVVGRSSKGRFAITVEMFNRTVIVNVDPLTALEILPLS